MPTISGPASPNGMGYQQAMRTPEVGIEGRPTSTDLARRDLHEGPGPSNSLYDPPLTEFLGTAFVPGTPLPCRGYTPLVKPDDSKLQQDRVYQSTVHGGSRFLYQPAGAVHLNPQAQVPQMREVIFYPTILGESDSESSLPSLHDTFKTLRPSGSGSFGGQGHAHPSSSPLSSLHDRSFDVGREEGSIPTSQAITDNSETRYGSRTRALCSTNVRHRKGSISVKSRDAPPKVLPQNTTTYTICARIRGKGPSSVPGVEEPSVREVTSDATNAKTGNNPANFTIGVQHEHSKHNHRRPRHTVELLVSGRMPF
ncbi:hypothetical protein PQX77_014162 [Marasmius sp. AFHP31]|nr:hypothetical protein PQX77_014162 [Marasmius sp. AFHP31]